MIGKRRNDSGTLKEVLYCDAIFWAVAEIRKWNATSMEKIEIFDAACITGTGSKEYGVREFWKRSKRSEQWKYRLE